MGQLIYGAVPAIVEIDDRALAHLRVVILAKLRRAEGFAFSWDEQLKNGSGRNTVWLHPAVTLQFKFFGTRQPTLNRVWLDDLMMSANSAGGLHLIPESTATESDHVAGLD